MLVRTTSQMSDYCDLLKSDSGEEDGVPDVQMDADEGDRCMKLACRGKRRVNDECCGNECVRRPERMAEWACRRHESRQSVAQVANSHVTS